MDALQQLLEDVTGFYDTYSANRSVATQRGLTMWQHARLTSLTLRLLSENQPDQLLGVRRLSEYLSNREDAARSAGDDRAVTQCEDLYTDLVMAIEETARQAYLLGFHEGLLFARSSRGAQ
jgi:hypothetical protein